MFGKLPVRGRWYFFDCRGQDDPTRLFKGGHEFRYRGRIMSMYMMMWGLTPLGTLPAGWIADRVGVSPVIGVQGALLAGILLYTFAFRPRVRELDAVNPTLEPVAPTDAVQS